MKIVLNTLNPYKEDCVLNETRSALLVTRCKGNQKGLSIQGKEFVTKEDLDDSFYICDLGKVLKKYEKWKRECSDITCFFAVKCNDNDVLLGVMAAVGINFDCASKAEIDNVLETGVSPQRIIYTHPQKPKTHLKYAKEHGVDLMVFDCLEELDKIHEVCGKDFPRLVLRIFEDNSSSQFPFGDKFGAKQNEFVDLISRVKELDMNLVGICFHCGTGCGSVKSYANAIKTSKVAFDVAKKFGYQISILDIGGGYVDDDKEILSLNEVITATRSQLVKSFAKEELSKLTLIAEPGRYLARPAYNIVSKVFGKRKMECDRPKMYYFVGEGVYNSFGIFLQHYTHQEPILLSEQNAADIRQEKSCIIFGPTCSGADTLLKDGTLPELYVGDYLMWKDWGRYSSTLVSGFNGFRIKDYYYVISSKMRRVFEEMSAKSIFNEIKFVERN